jgi:exodeoxyribonuclease-5
MSMKVRAGDMLDVGDYGESRVITKAQVDQRDVLNAEQLLVGLNRTRIAYNRRIRALLKRKGSLPECGEKLVCLRNNRRMQLLNGGLWTVERAYKTRANATSVKLDIVSDDVEGLSAKVHVLREFFEGGEESLTWEDRKRFQELTYGYALTVHKSQGSQWPDVYFFEEDLSGFLGREGQRRFVYTAVTRASERITIVR